MLFGQCCYTVVKVILKRQLGFLGRVAKKAWKVSAYQGRNKGKQRTQNICRNLRSVISHKFMGQFSFEWAVNNFICQ